MTSGLFLGYNIVKNTSFEGFYLEGVTNLWVSTQTYYYL